MTNDFCILLVEDDENDVFFFQRAAREAKIQNRISIARDGQEAMDYLSGADQFKDRSIFPLPCLIILDLKMPRKNGLEFLEWLRGDSALHTIPVIIFSSSAQGDDIETAYKLGANAFLVKPVSLEERTEVAELVRAFWLHKNQAPPVCRRHSTPAHPAPDKSAQP